MKRMIRSIALACALSSPVTVWADQPRTPHGDGEPRGARCQPLEKLAQVHAQALGISDATIASMKGIHQAARPDMDKLREAVHKAHKALRDGTGTESQLKTAHEAMHTRMEAVHSQIDGLLTPEQRAKLKEVAAKEGPCGPRGPRGPGRGRGQPA